MYKKRASVDTPADTNHFLTNLNSIPQDKKPCLEKQGR